MQVELAAVCEMELEMFEVGGGYVLCGTPQNAN